MNSPEEPIAEETRPAAKTRCAFPILKSAFLSPEGLHAGWRLLLFMGLACTVLLLLGRLSRLLGLRIGGGLFEPVAAIEGESVLFFSVFAAAAVMAKLERRSLAQYALPLKGAFGRVVLGGHDLIRYAGLWAMAFLAVAFFEEFAVRGYALFTMTTGIGFWPSAILLSGLFGAVHLENSGESWVGGLSAGLIGLFFCLTLRRTGSLWFAVGFHAAWDYAESFIYSVPDSGIMASGHLMDSSFGGPRWLTGGHIGPEGSVFVFPLLGLLSIAFARLNKEARFPGPAAPASNPPAEMSRAGYASSPPG